MNLSELSLDELWNSVLAFLPKLGLAILIYLVARFLSSWAARLLRKGMQRRDYDQETILLLEMLTRWSIIGLGIVLALEQVAPGKTTSLVAGLGIAGFTIGFALQDVAKNFVVGVQQPFEIGDAVEVAGYSGTVMDIILRTTEMRTWDRRLVIIPNGDVFVKPIINFSKAKHRVVNLSAGVAYESDPDKLTRGGVGSDELCAWSALKPGVCSDLLNLWRLGYRVLGLLLDRHRCRRVRECPIRWG